MNRHIDSCEDSTVAEFSHTNLVCLNILRLTIIVRKTWDSDASSERESRDGFKQTDKELWKKDQAVEFLMSHIDDCEQEIMKKSLKSLQFNPLFSFEQSKYDILSQINKSIFEGTL